MLRILRLNWRKCCVELGRSMKRVAQLLALVAAVLLVPTGSFGQGASHKIDHAVAAKLQSSPTAPQRVIITTLPGSRAAVHQSLNARGNTVVGDNARFSTLTSNVAGGVPTSSGQYKGIAPGARVVALRVLDANGQGYTSDVINAINFAITNKTALGIDIINLSLGHPIFEPAASDPLVQAVEAASRAG